MKEHGKSQGSEWPSVAWRGAVTVGDEAGGRVETFPSPLRSFPVSRQSELLPAMGWVSVKNPKRSPSVALSPCAKHHTEVSSPHTSLTITSFYRQDKLREARHLAGCHTAGTVRAKIPNSRLLLGPLWSETGKSLHLLGSQEGMSYRLFSGLRSQ